VRNAEERLHLEKHCGTGSGGCQRCSWEDWKFREGRPVAVERLQKILARAGIASRRASERIIQQGRVTVNGQVATLGMSADPNTDDIRLDGERLHTAEFTSTSCSTNPKGIISDEDVRAKHDNARDLIPLGGHLYPVGRLDLDSEGLMLFTNDGELALTNASPLRHRRHTACS
jgi:23S rRNA pseudouridine2605 synthase